MAGLLDLLSGRSSDIYGEGLLTPEQRGGLGNIGLLALAGKLGQLAGPSFSPVPDFGAALGQAAGAYGASQEGAGTAALNAILTAQKGRKLQQELDYGKTIGPALDAFEATQRGLLGMAGGGGGEGSGSSGGAAVSPSAGGGGGDAPPIPQSEAVDKARYYARLYGVPEEMFLHQINGENGFKSSGVSSAGAQGIAQFIPSTAKQYGVDVTNVDSSLDGAARYMRDLYKQTGSWEGALRGYLGAKSDATLAPILASNKPYAAAFAAARGGGAPAAASTAAAPAGAGGLLAVPAPNPLSDADPIVGTPKPAVAPQAAGGPLAAPAAPGDDARLRSLYDAAVGRVGRESFDQYKARVGPSFGAGSGSSAAAAPGQGASAEEPPGFAGRQLVAQLLARPPIDDASQYRQVAGPGAADAAAPPRAPLPTMGPTGVELPPMQGPLAAPAPAAAAPAAAGPGLLSPQGAAPAAALPQVNPGYDAIARQIAGLRVRARLAGLPDVFEALQSGLTSSPAYQAQVELAKRLGVFPLIGPEAAARTTAERGAAEPFNIREETLKADLQRRNAAAAQGYTLDDKGNAVQIPEYDKVQALIEFAREAGKSAGGLPAAIELKTKEARIMLDADLAKKGQYAIYDERGRPTIISGITGANETAAAQAGAVEKAQADARAAAELDKQKQLERFKVDPNAVGPGAAAPTYGPGATEPLPTERGTTIPPVTQATPIVGSPAYLAQRQTGPKGWSETEGGWAAAYPSTLMGEQRALAIGNAMKQYQTGAFASNLSEIRASLAAVGVQLPDSVAGDPAKAQEILKNAFGSTLEVLKAFSARPTQNEVTLSLKNWANPDLQPEANLKILAQTVGQMRWERALNEDFAQAKRYGWRDPQDFQTKWGARPENKLQTFVDKAEQEIGPLKGMGAAMTDAVKADALDYIKRGANRDAVIKKLRDTGWNPEGL